MKQKRIVILLLTVVMLLSVFPIFSHAEATDNGYFKNILPDTTVSQLKTLIKNVSSVKRSGVTVASDEKIATGDTVTTNNGDYTAIVTGDIFLQSTITVNAYIALKRHVLGTYTLSGTALAAADTNGDSDITAFDYLISKRYVLGTYSFPALYNTSGVKVLLYHHILPDAVKSTSQWSGNEITIATGEFRRHMQMLKDNNFNVVTIEDVVAYVRGEKLLPDKSIVLCFDDGYKSNTEYAAPILREFGYKATVFAIISGYSREYSENYDSSTLQKITPQDLTPNLDVITQECHTWNNHNQLSAQTYNQILTDLTQAQNYYHCNYFAYPYGDNDAEAVSAVKAAGFKAAFTTVARKAVVGDNILLIPRYTVTSPKTDSQYLSLING